LKLFQLRLQCGNRVLKFTNLLLNWSRSGELRKRLGNRFGLSLSLDIAQGLLRRALYDILPNGRSRLSRKGLGREQKDHRAQLDQQIHSHGGLRT
jgi:hypothetical protein